MSLSRRSRQGNQGEGEDRPTQTPTDETAPQKDPYMGLRSQIKTRLAEDSPLAAAASDEDKRKIIEERFNSIIAEANVVLARSERQRLLESIVADIIGLGPLHTLMADDTVTEIMVNGPETVFMVRKGRLSQANVRFENAAHVVQILERMLTPLGLKIDSPLLDVRLPDRTQVTAVLPPLAIEGPAVTIRKFSQILLTVQDLIRFGTLTPEIAVFLRAGVVARLNIVVSGGTGAGKTTLLNSLAGFIPADERIVTIERTPQLRLSQPNIVPLQGDSTAGGGSLVNTVQKMVFERCVLDDVRRETAFDALEAVSSGQDGMLFTLHAHNPRDALARLEQLCLRSGVPNLMPIVIRNQIASAVDLIVHIKRLRDGSRKVTHIAEVRGVEDDLITLSDIFEFEQTGMEAGRIIGRMRPTGIRPRFIDRMEGAGIHLAPSVFGIGARRGSATQQVEVVPQSPPAEPEVTAEDVYFTVYHPKEAAAEKWYSLLVYAHIQDALEQVQKDAQKFADEMAHDLREARSRKPARLARGTEIRFVAEAEGVEFKPSELALRWDEDFERANFRFKASADLIGQPCFGEVTVYVGPLEIASVRFSVFINDPAAVETATKPEQASAAAKMYQRIFTSYSHRDTTVVQSCVQAFKAIGYDVSVDYETLRSGEVWSEALEKMIDSADIFQLFWSPNAAQSEYVKREWTYALTSSARKGDRDATGTGFIRPVYWEAPPPDIPSELSHLHFKYLPSLVEIRKSR